MRKELLQLLRRNGVTEVHCDYSGSDDSGSIDMPTLNPPGQVNLSAPFMLKAHPWYKDQTLSLSVGDAIREIFYDFLEKKHPGWEINEGSQGEFTWDIVTDKISLEHGSNYTHVESYSYEF